MLKTTIRSVLTFHCFDKYSAFQKTRFLAIYEAKWGPFKLKHSTLKVVLGSWSSGSKQIRIRSFKWGTVHSCRLRGCKNIKGQSWRSIKNLPVQPALRASGSRLAALAIFLATSNFDLKYFCSLLTYQNVQCLIWKIWFISDLRLWYDF